MKAVILSGGTASRLLPLSRHYPKQLLPVGGKPILHYVVEDILAAGIQEIAVITSPQGQEPIQRSLVTTYGHKAAFSFLVQDKPHGLAHAVNLARAFVADETFLLYLGDNLVFEPIAACLVNHQTSATGAVVAVKPVADPSPFGIVEVSPSGKVLTLEEKPAYPRSNLAIMGVYRLPGDIFEFIDRLEYSWRGELELTDALQQMLNAGRELTVYEFPGVWLDVGSRESLLQANRYYLTRKMKPDEQSITTKMYDSNLIYPVYTGAYSSIDNSRLGPICTIGNNCQLTDVELENCLVMDNTSLRGVKARNKIFAPEFQNGI